MKKIIISVLAIGLSVGAFAQNVFYSPVEKSQTDLISLVKTDESTKSPVVVISYDSSWYRNDTLFTTLTFTPNDDCVVFGILLAGVGAAQNYADQQGMELLTALAYLVTPTSQGGGGYGILVQAEGLPIPTNWYGMNEGDEFEVSVIAVDNSGTGEVFQEIYTVSTVGLNDVVSDVNVALYPNPTQTTLTLNSPVKINNVEMYNVIGQQVYSGKVNATNTTINVSDLNTGNYLVKMQTENGVVTKKIVVK
jgi:hypothetical protein